MADLKLRQLMGGVISTRFPIFNNPRIINQLYIYIFDIYIEYIYINIYLLLLLFFYLLQFYYYLKYNIYIFRK